MARLCALKRHSPLPQLFSTPHGHRIPWRDIGEALGGGLVMLLIYATALLAMAAFGGCATQRLAAEAYTTATIRTHELIFPDLRTYITGDESLDESTRRQRVAAIDAQAALDALNAPSPEYCAQTITNHATLLPQASAYYTADPALVGGSLRLRTLTIEEQQRLDAQWLLDFGSKLQSTLTPGVHDDGPDSTAHTAILAQATRPGVHRLGDHGLQQGGQGGAGRRGPDHLGALGDRNGLRSAGSIDDGPGRGVHEAVDGARAQERHGAQPGPDRSDAARGAESRHGAAHRNDHAGRRPGQSLALAGLGAAFRAAGNPETHSSLRRAHAATDEGPVSAGPSEALHTETHVMGDRRAARCAPVPRQFTFFA